jgi:uncharacterized membrane protein YfcA
MVKAPSMLRKHFHSALVGFVGGGSVGLVGWGGAQVIIPGMTMSPLSLGQLSATGISLASLSVSTMSSGIKFLREDKVAVYTALAIAVPSVVTARIGTHFAKKLSGDVLSLIFNGLSILLIPTHLWIQRRAERRRHPLNSEIIEAANETTISERFVGQPIHLERRHIVTNGREVETKTRDKLHGPQSSDLGDIPVSKAFQHAFFGAFSGLLSSLMGVGGLPFTMSYLTEFTDLHHHVVQGTSVCSVIPSILTSVFSRMTVIPMATAGMVSVGAVVST